MLPVKAERADIAGLVALLSKTAPLAWEPRAPQDRV
jgi:hypothetical protein